MKRMVLAGGSGLLGKVLANYFSVRGYDIAILSRFPRKTSGTVRELFWDARTIGPWATELEQAEVLINLTGRTVDCRYHERNRREILDSRVESTRVLGEAIARCEKLPCVWLNSSTATIYKHTFGPAWDESGEIAGSPEAKDLFSVDVATAWEKEFFSAPAPKTRRVALRTAMVLSCGKNSVFPVLRRLVRFGLGGRMGTGRQFVSWIHDVDFCRAIEWIIANESLKGVVNVCAPNPLPNAEMMRTFRELYGNRLGLPATEWMLEIGAFFLRTETELIIKSRRVVPKRLIESGFQFEFPFFHEAIENLEKRLEA